MTPFKKDQIKAIHYNRFYSYFLVTGLNNVTIWNSFTGLKLLTVHLQCSGQPLGSIKSLVPSQFLRHSLSQYFVSSEGKLYSFDLVDGTQIEPEPQSRMFKHGKITEITLESRLLFDLQRDLILDRQVFSVSYLCARSSNSVCIIGDNSHFDDHIKSHQLYFTRTPSALVASVDQPRSRN